MLKNQSIIVFNNTNLNNSKNAKVAIVNYLGFRLDNSITAFKIPKVIRIKKKVVQILELNYLNYPGCNYSIFAEIVFQSNTQVYEADFTKIKIKLGLNSSRIIQVGTLRFY